MRFLLLLTLLLPCFTQAAQITDARIWASDERTRFVIDVTEQPTYRDFALSNPSRHVIDISGVVSAVNFGKLGLENSGFKIIRSAKRGDGIRLVFELNDQFEVSSLLLKPNGEYQHRLVFDFTRKSKPVIKSNTNEAPVSSVSGQRDLIVAIDAGHGGDDPGAIGPRGTREKDVVLKIATELASQINAKSGYKAILMRKNDFYISLSERRNKARALQADLFISIHADAFTNSKANGASVFALSTRGASSTTAKYLADKENATDVIGGVGGVSLEDRDEILREVLVDISMNATMHSSLEFATFVHAEMSKMAKMHKDTVEQANFSVLRSPDMPSILVETGFISNHAEEQKLNNAAYRQKMATAIFKGVQAWAAKNQHKTQVNTPPSKPSKAAAAASLEPQYGIYEVKAGDSLSMIAVQHDMTLADITAINQLSSPSLRIGQKLKVTKDLSANDLVVAQTPAEQYQEYRVQSGDSVTAIAVRFGMSVKDLKAINNLRSSQIKIGQRLKVVAQPVVQRYKVKSGDNLSAIAAEYDTSVKVLLELNDLSSAAIWVGQVLKVPTK